MENNEAKKHLKEVKDLGMQMRKAQSNYFKQVRSNKTKGAVWVDPMPLLDVSKKAEKDFDDKLKELLELDKKAVSPELFETLPIMTKPQMVRTKEFKELVKQFMIDEAYGACDINSHSEQQGLKSKQRASDLEIEMRIDYFIDRTKK